MVAGEIDLTAAERDEEGEDQAPAADAAADDQPEQAGPSRGAARTRRSAPLPTDDDADMEVMVSSNSIHVLQPELKLLQAWPCNPLRYTTSSKAEDPLGL